MLILRQPRYSSLGVQTRLVVLWEISHGPVVIYLLQIIPVTVAKGMLSAGCWKWIVRQCFQMGLSPLLWICTGYICQPQTIPPISVQENWVLTIFSPAISQPFGLSSTSSSIVPVLHHVIREHSNKDSGSSLNWNMKMHINPQRAPFVLSVVACTQSAISKSVSIVSIHF